MQAPWCCLPTPACIFNAPLPDAGDPLAPKTNTSTMLFIIPVVAHISNAWHT